MSYFAARSIDTRLTILFQRAVYELTQLGRLVPAMQAAVARASVSLATARNSARVQRERASKSAAELEEYKRVSTLSSVK